MKCTAQLILVCGSTGAGETTYSLNVAKALGINAEVHYLEVQKEVRKKRVEKRNTEKDPAVYVFQVTDMMFNVMAPRFEALMKKSYILAARFKVN